MVAKFFENLSRILIAKATEFKFWAPITDNPFFQAGGNGMKT
jgi:hypothetical protein